MKHIILLYILLSLNLSYSQGVISIDKVSSLKNRSGTQGVIVHVLCKDSVNDRLGKVFYWDNNSVEDPNDSTIIKVNFTNVGRWKYWDILSYIRNISGLEDNINSSIKYNDTFPNKIMTTAAAMNVISDLESQIDAIQSPVNPDWNASSGLAAILNKPSLGTAAYQNSTDFASAAQGLLAQTALQSETDGSVTNEIQTLSGSGNQVILSNGGGSYTIPNQSFSSISGKPTTLSGYGITDAYPLSGNPSGFINQSQARSSVSLTTTGSGLATYNSSTGVLNIPPHSSTNIPLRDKSGLITNTPIFFTDTFSISSATPTIDLSAHISAAGKTSCKIISAIAYRAGATTSNSPNITITGMTSTSVSLIANQTNTATVTILTFNVLSGLPTVLVSDPANIKILLSAYFY